MREQLLEAKAGLAEKELEVRSLHMNVAELKHAKETLSGSLKSQTEQHLA